MGSCSQYLSLWVSRSALEKVYLENRTNNTSNWVHLFVITFLYTHTWTVSRMLQVFEICYLSDWIISECFPTSTVRNFLRSVVKTLGCKGWADSCSKQDRQCIHFLFGTQISRVSVCSYVVQYRDNESALTPWNNSETGVMRVSWMTFVEEKNIRDYIYDSGRIWTAVYTPWAWGTLQSIYRWSACC